MNRKIALLVFVICAVCANAFVYCFVAEERFIHSWDTANYWLKYQHVSDQIREAPFKALKSVAHSVRHDDYNLLSVLFLAPWNHLFGDSRVAFILAITNILALPSAAVLAWAVAKTLSERHAIDPTATFSLFLFTILLLPQFWIPVLWGEIGVIGLSIIGLILLMYFAKRVHEFTFWELLAMGGLLACLVLLRRWYAYWVAAFFAAAGIETTVAVVAGAVRTREFLISLRNLSLAGISSVAVLFIVATPVAVRMVTTDYASLYSAWKFGKSFADIILASLGHYGGFLLLLSLVGMVSAIAVEGTRRLSCFSAIQASVAFLLFARTQLMGPQHHYVLLTSVAVLTTLFWINVLHALKSVAARRVSFGTVAFLFVLNFSVVFSPFASESIKGARVLLPYVRSYPLVRNDLDELYRLLDVLERHSCRDEDGRIYVLSSSAWTLNDEILSNACAEIKRGGCLCGRIMSAHHVDKRDGFPVHLLDARYVIVTTPVQYHLDRDDQRVIGIPSEKIQSGQGIGVSYARLPYEFRLGEDVKVHVYERILPMRRCDLEEIFAEFASHYPEWASTSAMTALCGLISGRETGDHVGQISCEGTTLFIHPGVHTPSRVLLALSKDFAVMRMTLSFRDAKKVPVACREIDGEIALTITADGRTLYQDNVTYREPVPLQLNLQGINTLEILVDKGRNGPDCDWFLLKGIEME